MPPRSNPPKRTCFSPIWTSWEWEFAACLLLLATPIIIFSTLYPHDGQPLPQWPFKISINSLLSVYALVFKAAMGLILTSCIGQLQWRWFSETRPLADMLLFDNATRGADGALGLIWRQKFRKPLTALGCVITVLAVAVDPFVQQLVQPVDCSVEVSGGNAIATLPRANVFEGLGYDGDANVTDPTRSKIDLGMTDKDIDSALYDAIFSPGQGPPRQCSTGNCTFADTYGTIGMCSFCQDASADVNITGTCSDPDSSYASHHPASGADCPADSGFTLDSNFSTGEYIELGTRMEISSSGTSDTPVVAAGDSETHQESMLSGTRNLLFGFLLGATTGTGGRTDWTASGSSRCGPNEPKGSWSCQGYGAATCSLQPCVQIYKATISAGILEEHLVESSSDTAWGMIYDKEGEPAYLTLIDAQCAVQVQTPSGWSSSMGSRWLPYNFNLSIEFDTSIDVDVIHLPDDAKALLESGCLYIMSADSILSAAASRLDGTILPNSLGGQGSSAADAEVYDLSNFEGPEMIRSIYNWGHTDPERVRSVLANISDSLTTYIRAHGGSPNFLGSTDFSKDVQGKVYHYATCLQVQWPWLSYPASLAVLTVLFFFMVTEATRRQGTSVWKASPLAWVLRVEGPGNEVFPASHGSCKSMKDRSTQVAVQLFDGGPDGPRIRVEDLKDPNLL